jgi:hypothetical protein
MGPAAGDPAGANAPEVPAPADATADAMADAPAGEESAVTIGSNDGDAIPGLMPLPSGGTR